jgi:predicted regulator of Ras-like GTPase activity (Roadblock/LC7/MglB family)
VYRGILDELLATTSGAFAAIFLDFEGETVQLVCDRDLSDHDLRIVGAYQALFWERLRRASKKTKIGSPLRFMIEFESLLILCSDLKDGYHVVMLLDSDADEVSAWRQIDLSREKLLSEL